MGSIYVEQIARLTEVIDRLSDELESSSQADEQLRRLCTIPGIGPVTAGAVAAFAPDLDAFNSGRNFADWLGVRFVSRTDRVPARTTATKVDGRKGQGERSTRSTRYGLRG